MLTLQGSHLGELRIAGEDRPRRLAHGFIDLECATVAVGDTVTSALSPAAEPLPGYKKVQSVVFCGIYPLDGSKFNDLKDALLKLQLNDASLLFEPDTSVALGFGFRCGFLGLLHMEIIQERIEREFNLDIITTAPSVSYLVHKTDGEQLFVDNPSHLPDPSDIDYMEEPIVKVELYSPPEYIGSIMDLCQDKRGVFKDMTYLDEKRVKLLYTLPLNEIIYDFFDQVKSRTRGYASFDYELIGYEKSDLVKLDILLNGDVCDALSMIVHKDRAYPRGRELAENLFRCGNTKSTPLHGGSRLPLYFLLCRKRPFGHSSILLEADLHLSPEGSQVPKIP